MVTAAVAGGHERFPVLGLSLGSTVAVTAAARHPDRVSGLVLVVGFAASDAQSRAFAELYAALARADRIDDLARLLLLSTGSPAKLATTPPATVDLLADYHRGRAAGLAPQLDLVRSVDVRAALPGIRVPTLVVGATHDRIVLPASTRALADAISGAQYAEVDGAGHLFTAPESARLGELVSLFLSRNHL
ncbi:alpha/beta fold hydrolase [Tsukamurella soli]|uniref:alpha/beta fold hydrolase n=1 Tax=Tsukamurella soli TaxID=644556 RepID=UPI003623206F